jgi:hypothetical protein
VDAYLRRTTILLEVSRIHSSNLRLRPTEVDLSALVRQVAMGMSPAAEGAGCRVGLTVQEGVTGRFDATALEQILENLLSNAIRLNYPAVSIDQRNARLTVRDRESDSRTEISAGSWEFVDPQSIRLLPVGTRFVPAEPRLLIGSPEVRARRCSAGRSALVPAALGVRSEQSRFASNRLPAPGCVSRLS